MINTIRDLLKEFNYSIEHDHVLSEEYIDILKSIGKTPTRYYKIYNSNTKEDLLELAKMEFIKGYNKEVVYQLLHLKDENIKIINYQNENKSKIVYDIINFVKKEVNENKNSNSSKSNM